MPEDLIFMNAFSARVNASSFNLLIPVECPILPSEGNTALKEIFCSCPIAQSECIAPTVGGVFGTSVEVDVVDEGFSVEDECKETFDTDDDNKTG
mmetsp:Transcript_48707/g.85797  ORF Transcript_48707/g.85797 Transcript_48707/m.85797 type:complete len:95 (+) Transcript_48707:517-801(+)